MPDTPADGPPPQGRAEHEVTQEHSARAEGEVRTDDLTLRSLASTFNKHHHDRYVQHLETAVGDVKNKNVAVTGRYGTGKSSVLDRFEETHRDDTLRISITTLGPDRDGEGLTNRIQKELVKQLVYRAEPGKLRSSRFARTNPLTPKRAAAEAAGVVGVAGPLLWMAGWLPHIAGTGTGHHPAVRILAALLFVGLATAMVWTLRMLVGTRDITGFSTAGASISLKEREDTYFDAYLDELVTYFDQRSPDFVIFEDLDRFDDPQIFDSLRELNTILNSSHARRRKPDKPIRFIYAIKDSLFERSREKDTEKADVSTDSNSSHDDPGADPVPEPVAADPRIRASISMVERANRTKFFDVVIPVVPFLSHRNARDLLAQEMEERRIPKGTVQRPLLSLVARHTTDMRLLLNILNEFVVYAERLLWATYQAPDITGDRLFALVAYKNFYLADFEGVPVRGSALDRLDKAHRDLVRDAVRQRQTGKTEAANYVSSRQVKNSLADRLGRELVAAAKVALYPSYSGSRTEFEVASEVFTAADARTPRFWQEAAEHTAVTVLAVTANNPSRTRVTTFDAELLKATFPEGMDEDMWIDSQATARDTCIGELNNEIEALRGADYADLAREGQFTNSNGETFNDLVDQLLPPGLARELVRGGYINRNFATYSAVFYGTFAGIDVETFYHRSVLPNEMLLDHRFTTRNAVPNLLEQVEPDFFGSVSALNPQIITHLLEHDQDRARVVAAFLATNFDDNAREFMTAYLAEENAPHTKLIETLTAHPWRDVFDYLTSDGSPEHMRLNLVNAALLAADDVKHFNVTESVSDFLLTHYVNLPAFTKRQDKERSTALLGFAKHAGVRVEQLEVVAKPLRMMLVAEQMYHLTAHNLRVALGIKGAVPLDRLAEDDHVSTYCRERIDDYLTAIARDDATTHSVESAEFLTALLAEQHEDWTSEQLAAVLETSAPRSAVADLNEVPEACWSLAAKYGRFVLTVANLEAYTTKIGIDDALAGHLTSAAEHAVIQVREDDALESRVALAVKLLNARDHLTAADRARLAAQLDLDAEAVPLGQITPAADDLLAEALDNGLLEPTDEAFMHFLGGGWPALATATSRFPELRDFVTPDRVGAVLQQILEDDDTDPEVHEIVLSRLDEFVPAASSELLRAAAARAVRLELELPVPQIDRIADHVPDPDVVVLLLAQHSGLDGDDLVAILVKLGEPYNLLQAGAGTELSLPPGEAATKVFRRLESTGKVKMPTKRQKMVLVR